jgi:hypothetical protein
MGNLWNTHVRLPRCNLRRYFFQFLELQRKVRVRDAGDRCIEIGKIA